MNLQAEKVISPFEQIPNHHNAMQWGDLLHDLYKGHGESLCASVISDVIRYFHVCLRGGDRMIYVIYVEQIVCMEAAR